MKVGVFDIKNIIGQAKATEIAQNLNICDCCV